MTLAQLVEALRSTAARWRASNLEHREGVVLVWNGEVYGWKDELRDPTSERHGAYAVDKAGLIFRAEGATTTRVQKRGVAIDPDAQ